MLGYTVFPMDNTPVKAPERKEYIMAATAYFILGLIILRVAWTSGSGNSATFYAISAVSLFFIWLGITSYLHIFFNDSKTNLKRAGIAGLLLNVVARLFTK